MSNGRTITLHTVAAEERREARSVELPNDHDREPFDDVVFMTAMNLVLFGNYAQTGHFGGPLAYTPYNVAAHLAGPELGGLSYDLRDPKFAYADKFMLAGGHNIPTCYSLWMILYEALERTHRETGDERYAFDPAEAVLSIDALGFRRSEGALATLLQDAGVADDPLFEQAKIRGIRALMGHAENTDVTNDVNGGPSGIGISTAAGKAMFWDYVGGPPGMKVIALEGEFALTEGHAQELKTAALAQRVGKRLRILMSWNNAGIDDELIGGVVHESYAGIYDIANQWASYGWNVFTVDDANDVDQVLAVLKTMEEWPADDRRPMILVGPTVKGWWPAATGGKLPNGSDQVVSYPSHPYSQKMNSEYFVALAESYEKHFGVEFTGIRDGVPGDEAERLRQFKTNVDVCLSVMDRKPGLREWIANRLLAIADTVERTPALRRDVSRDPFLDERLLPENLPAEPVEATLTNPHTNESVTQTIKLFEEPGAKRGTRRAISEVGKWLNYVTEGGYFSAAADLSGSINLEKGHFFGHYDPVENPAGTRLKAAITEAVNAATICGLAGQNAAPKVKESFGGVWGVSGTYGAFTPLMYTPVRVHSQQNQDCPYPMGVVTILAGHSGPETAADARTHFGIFAPQVWTLFPRGQIINLYFWDYNDVAPGYFAAVAHAARTKHAGVIAVHVARPDVVVADRSTFADPDPRAAAKGIYLIRDWAEDRPKHGTVWVQGASSTVNLVSVLPRLEAEGLNVRVASVVSPDLFALQPEAYRNRILGDADRFDSMVVSTMTKRVPPVENLGPLTEEYSLYADFDDRWRSGGLEGDVIAEARLDEDSIFEGVRRFATERDERLERQRRAFETL